MTNITAERSSERAGLLTSRFLDCGAGMSFVLNTERVRSAIDPDIGAQMGIDRTPEIDQLVAKFRSPEGSFNIALMLVPKYSDRPVRRDDRENPGIMISSRYMNLLFDRSSRRDVEDNTRLVDYMVRMIAFINKHYPLAISPYLWSDYDKFATSQRFLYRMPSDEELLSLSLQLNN